MPQGSYLLTGPAGRPETERFSCAPGPLGWRYAATREDTVTGRRLGTVDLIVDTGGAALRLEVVRGPWVLRGGVVGGRVLWRRGEEEHEDDAAGFAGTSPGLLVAAALLARGEELRVALAEVDDAALGVRVVRRQWRPLGERTGSAGAPERGWLVADLDTGEGGEVWLAGDVVVEAPGCRLQLP